MKPNGPQTRAQDDDAFAGKTTTANCAELRVYRWLLGLYPAAFRARYGAEQMASAAAWQQDSVRATGTRGARLQFAFMLGRDLAISAAQQRFIQLWRVFMKRPVVVYSIVLFVLIAGIIVFSAVFDHALLRHSADQPQQQMAERYAQRLSSGAAPESVLPGGHIDIRNDLDPFVNVYDENGAPLAGNGYLGDALPVPPSGVFAVARANGRNKLSWRPEKGTRVAMVAEHFSGARAGFVVAGRSLSDVERHESQIYGLSIRALLLLFIGLTAAGVMLTRAVDRRSGPAAA